MSTGPTKRLVVTGGLDSGVQLLVDEQLKLVGRARDAHMVLSDRRVSRHHFHVCATAGGAYVRVCHNAAPLVYDGREIGEAEVHVGGTIVVGDTLLIVAGPADADVAPEANDGATTIGSLLTGAAADVRAFAAMFALNEALTSASDAAALESVLASWARAHAHGTRIEFLPGQPARESSPETEPLVDTALSDGRTRILVPAHGTSIAFTLALPPARIRDALRRLLVLAAALYASHRARLTVLATVKEDREILRRQAVGSAHSFLGTSPAAAELTRIIPRLAGSDVPLLLLGETGVGKTFVARLIHETGPRKDAPMRVINCASIPEALVESELFGHERGAFTGAVSARVGAFEAAGQGTVLLDEIGELSLLSQAKLLRALEEKCIERLGSNRPLTLRARIIAATNRDLEAMVAARTFRSDLYFRITVLRATVPPLRERGDDLLLLAQRILSDLAPNAGRRIEGFSPEALDAIRAYAWPGNVRELRNAIEIALVLGDGPHVMPRDLSLVPPAVPSRSPRAQHGDDDTLHLPTTLEELERRAVESAVRVTGGNITKAAALLGISRNTLHSKLRPKK